MSRHKIVIIKFIHVAIKKYVITNFPCDFKHATALFVATKRINVAIVTNQCRDKRFFVATIFWLSS